jgi:cell division protein FtsQ
MKRSDSGNRSSSKRQRKRMWKTFFTRRTLVIAGMFLVVCSGLMGGVWLYRLSSGLFPVKEISFSGNVHMSEGDLKSLIAVTPHEGLLRLSTKRVSESLLKSPWIKDASVRKEFPCRISVRVHEVSPFAILEMKGHAFLIDEKGKVLDEMKGSVPFLPVITADPFKNREVFMEAVNLAGVLKEKRIATERNRVEIVAGNGPESISMILDNVLVKVGQGNYEQKLNRLFELEDEIKKRAIAVDYVDLRFADRVVVKPINEVVR